MKKKFPIRSIIIIVLVLVSYVVKQQRANDETSTPNTHQVATDGSMEAEADETSVRTKPITAKVNPPVASSRLPIVEATHTSKLLYHEGKLITVTGKVSKSNTTGSGHQFLNFNGAAFSIFCSKDILPKFKGGGPAILYEGKEIAATGIINNYKGNPQIKLTGPDDIREAKPGDLVQKPRLGQLKEMGRNKWRSMAGMVYSGTDSEGLTRVEHVLRHAEDQPNRQGNHGVFDANGDDVFALIDEAWLRAKKKGIRANNEGHTSTYTIPMDRKIGYGGGRSGASKGNPALFNMFIVVRSGTQEVITAYPR